MSPESFAALQAVNSARASSGEALAWFASRNPPGRCEFAHCFNVVTSAGKICQFAGVLTGLTFTAIIFLAGRERDQHPQVETTLILFLAAFVSLIFATYLFAEVSAEETPDYRAAVESLLASVVLATALLQLFLGITQLMRDRRLPEVTKIAARLAGWFLGPVTFSFVALTAINAWGLNQSEAEASGSAVGVVCLAMGLIWVCVAVVPRWPTIPLRLSPTRWVYSGLALVVLATLLSAYWAERGIHARLPGSAVLIVVGALLALGIGYSLLLRRLALEAGAAVGRLVRTGRRRPRTKRARRRI